MSNQAASTFTAGDLWELALPNASSLQLVWCPPGTFKLGSPIDQESDKLASESPQIEILLTEGFWMGQTPITGDQWRSLMDATGLDGEGHRPIECLSWKQAMTFCDQLTVFAHSNGNALGYQFTLPTEAQWEYACRAGTESPWYFGDSASDLGDHAWYRENANFQTHEVGLKQPNPWGLYDLYGNVEEWCLDDFNSYGRIYTDNRTYTDPLYFQGKVYEGGHPLQLESIVKATRGGSFLSPDFMCNNIYRGNSHVNNSFRDPIGMRVICKKSD